jgi:hypothetical protein
MDVAILYNEDMVRIGVQAIAAQECIELTKVFAVEDKDGRAVGRNIFAPRANAECAYKQKHNQAADFLIARANTHGEGNPFKSILAGAAGGPQGDAGRRRASPVEIAPKGEAQHPLINGISRSMASC